MFTILLTPSFGSSIAHLQTIPSAKSHMLCSSNNSTVKLYCCTEAHYLAQKSLERPNTFHYHLISKFAKSEKAHSISVTISPIPKDCNPGINHQPTRNNHQPTREVCSPPGWSWVRWCVQPHHHQWGPWDLDLAKRHDENGFISKVLTSLLDAFRDDTSPFIAQILLDGESVLLEMHQLQCKYALSVSQPFRKSACHLNPRS